MNSNKKYLKSLKIILFNILSLIAIGLVLLNLYNFTLKKMASNDTYIKLKVDNGEAIIMDRKQVEFLNLVPNTYYQGTITKGNKITKKFDVNIDSNGFRKTPVKFDSNKGSVVFFGCSYTFGYALNDNETFPWVISELTKRKTHNVSFPGFGAQQMLRNLQSKDFAKKVKNPDYFIYIFIRDHILRLYGPPFLDPNMYYAKFKLTKGQLEYLEPSEKYINYPKIRRHINEMDFIKMKNSNINDENLINLYVAVLKESQQLSKKMYPESNFIVFDLENMDNLDNLLKKEGIEVMQLKDIFEESYYPKYIIKDDCHPTAEFWKLISPKFIEKLGL